MIKRRVKNAGCGGKNQAAGFSVRKQINVSPKFQSLYDDVFYLQKEKPANAVFTGLLAELVGSKPYGLYMSL